MTRHRRRTAQAYRQHPVVFVSGFLQAAFAKTSAMNSFGDVIHNAVDAHALDAALSGETSTYGAEARFPVEFFSAGAMFAYKGYGQLLLAIQQRALVHVLLPMGGWTRRSLGDAALRSDPLCRNPLQASVPPQPSVE